MENYDLIVIGGGPGGYAAAISAAKAGLNVAIFEKQKVGGTCLNVGCIPTKYLLDKANTMEKIRALTNDGVFKDAGLFSFKKIQAGRVTTVNKLTSGVQMLLKANKATLVDGEAVLKAKNVVTCNNKEYTAKNIIIATGSYPVRIPIPGADLTIDSTQALALERIPNRLCVIGGGVIGLELASAYASFGSEVTIIEMLDGLLANEQPEAAKVLVSALKKRGFGINTSSKVLSVEKTNGGLKVTFEKDSKKSSVEADAVLMAIGRKPNFAGIDAKELGLELTDRGFIKVNDYMQTNLEGVYAVGDVAGGYQLAHAAYAEAETAVRNIIKKESDKLDVSVMPRCIYTAPCFAAVGITTAQAETLGVETVVGSFKYEANGMALAEGASGSVFVIMDKNKKETIGVQIVGENASELISFASSAVANHTNLEQWEKMIVAHPSLSEMVKEAALDAFKKAIHKA